MSSYIRSLLLLLLCLSLSSTSYATVDADALLALKTSLSNSASLGSWKPDSLPCRDKWTGVFCLRGGNETVIRLHLTGMGLSGPIDVDALNNITGLLSLSFTNNSFSGPLPSFNRIPGLKALYLSGNNFSGQIPPDFFSGLTLRRVFLSFNHFSGPIPTSLAALSTLQQLHLQTNDFSGPIPDISQKSLTDLNLSNNRLEGEVPAGMSRFGPDAFKGNAGICGQVVGVQCQPSNPLNDSSVDTTNNSPKVPGENKTAVGVMLGILGVMFVLFILTTALKSRAAGDDFSVLGNERMADDVVQVRVHGNGTLRKADGGGVGGGGLGGSSSARRSVDASGRNKVVECSTRKGGAQGGAAAAKAGMGDLVVINDEKGVFGLADLMKAAAEVLGNGGLGSAYKAMMGNGVSVVVKRIREMDKVGSKEEFDAEIRRIGSVRHPNILTPLAYHYRKEEKLVIFEYIPKGSLLYVLHGDRGICHAELNWPTRLKIIKGMARGMHHLHTEFPSSNLPHGNLKSSNVLLDHRYEPLLSDYGFLPLVKPSQAAQAMFSFKAPEAAAAAASPESQQRAVSPKTDVYCLGLITLEILTGKFPSQYLSAGKGGTDIIQWVRTATEDQNEIEFLDPEIASCTESVPEMVRLLHIGAACTESNPDQRPTMEEAARRIEDVST